MIKVRTMEIKDSQEFNHTWQQLLTETRFLLCEPGETADVTIEQTQSRVQHILNQENSTNLVAEGDGRHVGYLMVNGGMFKRNRHSAYIVVAVLQAYANQGVGAQLFEALFAWASEHQLTRLDLTVMSHNKAAIALYQKMGFEIEGTKRQSLCVDGIYRDEYYMAKILD
ncbi:MAG: GNAT family N-acetyltransferase [Legionellaceae bacterium]|nr:GNAT family N-acetyltransferase [Legionellaceae bacterium]